MSPLEHPAFQDGPAASLPHSDAEAVNAAPSSLFRLVCPLWHGNLTGFNYTQRREAVSKRALFIFRQVCQELAAESFQRFCLDLTGSLGRGADVEPCLSAS
jgi:hypothetical protein